MDQIKRFIDCAIPTEACNLRCHYCYIAQKRKFSSILTHLNHSPLEIRRALSKSRLGGTCLFNLCAGGETLLSEEVLPIVYQLLEEGHYVMIVTNGTITSRFEEICTWPPEYLSRLFFKFSFHYLELIRTKMLDRFFANIKMIRSKGVSFTLEITPSDELIPYIDDVKSCSFENLGALCHVTIARDDRTSGIDILSSHSFDEYKQIWEQFDSDLFDFKKDLFYKKRTEFCYAGDWSLYLNLGTGRLTQCYCGKELCNIYTDITSPIPFEAIGRKCSLPHCYNGHAFLALGDIPNLHAPTYAQVRNRLCSDGTEWLSPTMKAFMSTKLYDSNREYSTVKKLRLSVAQKWQNLRHKIHRIKTTLIHKK